MELTSKQRAQLRGLANNIDTILIVGKDGIGDNLVKQANDALEARELIKGRVLENNIEYDARLAAQELGLGAVWLGTWPQMDRVEAQKKLFALPEAIVPNSIIALGYPEADITAPRASRYEADRVHFNQW